jgi:uncharacterized protein with HEPN domain
VRLPRERLQDILDAIDAVERYAVRGRGAFDRDELIPVWMCYHIRIVGDAARTLPDTVRAQAPEVPWRLVIGMRHMIVHSYPTVDQNEIWDTATRDLPAMRLLVERLIAFVEGAPGGAA